MKVKAAFLTDLKTISFQEVELPELKDDEARVDIKHMGICGSDMHFFEEGHIGTNYAKLPFLLGHECAGTVSAVGKNVKDLKVGDNVAIEPGIPCGKCEFCKEGRYNLCKEVKFLAAPPTNGALMESINYPAHMLFKLPDNVSTLEGALIEPLAVGIHAANIGEVCPGKTVVILGAGCIGLTTILAAKAKGASKIVVTDLYDKRLEKALELGADVVVNSSANDAIERIKAHTTDQEGYNIVFETAGSHVTLAQTTLLVKRGGTIVLVGNISGDVPFNFRNITINEVNLKPVWRYRNIYPIAIKQISNGRIDIKKIASDIFSFKDAQKAFEKASYDKANVIKAVIEF